MMDANQVPLEPGNWGREKAREAEKGIRVLDGKVRLEKGRCGPNICCMESSCVSEVANGDAFTTAVAENERADLAHQRALRLAAEAALKSRIRAQLALKRCAGAFYSPRLTCIYLYTSQSCNDGFVKFIKGFLILLYLDLWGNSGRLPHYP